MSRDEDPSARTVFLITCEHGGNEVPPAYAHLFEDQVELLNSHRGYDIGALSVALRMASSLSAPILFSLTTRLLVDLNRSLDQLDLFSELTRELTGQDREAILRAHYAPHRESVESWVACSIDAGQRVIHLGVHSCTDVLHGQTRDLDIALLFDASRELEAEFCAHLQTSLTRQNDALRYPFNKPYNGADDGLTTALRSRFAPSSYLGIEIEVRQGLVGTLARQDEIGRLIAGALLNMSAKESVR